MRQVFALLLTLFASLIYGCTPWGQAMTPPVTQPTPCSDFCFGGNMVSEGHNIGNIGQREIGSPKATEACHSGYTYVADGKAQSLLVYCFGVAGAPIRSVALDGAPFQPATDGSGRVYVTEMLASEVQYFSRGGEQRLGTLHGVSAPEGVTAVGGKVYVANHPVAGTTFGFVTVYTAGSPDVVQTFNAPPGFAVIGIAVDESGDRFETLIDKGANGMLVEYAPQAQGYNYNEIASLGRPCWCGVSMDGSGNVNVGIFGRLTTFVHPGFTKSYTTKLNGPGILTFFSHDRFGTFVPLNDGAGKSQVEVFPAYGSEAPYVLREGMQTPLGAAGGI